MRFFMYEWFDFALASFVGLLRLPAFDLRRESSVLILF